MCDRDLFVFALLLIDFSSFFMSFASESPKMNDPNPSVKTQAT